MDITCFKYDKETHTGTYKGLPIPSITQLVGIKYPLDNSIPEDRLEVAAQRGTMIHEDIEVYNNFTTFDDDFPAFKFSRDCPRQEVRNYRNLLNVYHLKPYKWEETVFLLDESGEPICYGHYDLLVKALEDNIAFEKDNIYLLDLKTTSEFDKKKTRLQTHLYRVALKQRKVKVNQKTYGLHLRTNEKEDKKLIIPLEEMNDKEVIQIAKELREIWNEQPKNS